MENQTSTKTTLSDLSNIDWKEIDLSIIIDYLITFGKNLIIAAIRISSATGKAAPARAAEEPEAQSYAHSANRSVPWRHTAKSAEVFISGIEVLSDVMENSA